ncbi:pirin family protein [Paracoccus cavernae]|uniref:Pirin family protein n=1 Tax=Paracoccus cavernae TaxID=1571207 RepID=A0ABT8D899_9RHOB|nr:pirin family protein [Paracoccus cavernae]
MRKILSTKSAPRGHWVGDGFPVRSLLSDMEGLNEFSPFLLLDYAGPEKFGPAKRPRGVDVHPHKGFETVTIVYQGEVEHGDSTGQGGVIREGDVQWMTAADGILHKEFHSHDFTKRVARWKWSSFGSTFRPSTNRRSRVTRVSVRATFRWSICLMARAACG